MNDRVHLAALQKGRETRGITVRVVRKWTVKADQGHGDVLYVGLVLSDTKVQISSKSSGCMHILPTIATHFLAHILNYHPSGCKKKLSCDFSAFSTPASAYQGDALYAKIPAEVVPKKEYLLELGKVYVIKKFKVTNAKPSFRTVDKPLMIEVSEFTTIELAKNYPPTIPEYVYRLTPFQSIDQLVIRSSPTQVNRAAYKFSSFDPAFHLTLTTASCSFKDVIGYITKYTEVESFVPKNKEKVTHIRKLVIKDLRYICHLLIAIFNVGSNLKSLVFYLFAVTTN